MKDIEYLEPDPKSKWYEEAVRLARKQKERELSLGIPKELLDKLKATPTAEQMKLMHGKWDDTL